LFLCFAHLLFCCRLLLLMTLWILSLLTGHWSLNHPKNDLFDSFSGDIDAFLAEEKMTSDEVVSDAVDLSGVFFAELDVLNETFYDRAANMKALDIAFWQKYLDLSTAVLKRRVTLALFLAIDADADMEKARALTPLIDAINSELNYAHNGLSIIRKSMNQFDTHYWLCMYSM